MKFERMINRILLEGVVGTVGSRQGGQLKDEADFKRRMTAQGYTFEPIPATDKDDDGLYNHDPVYPTEPVEKAEAILDAAQMRLANGFLDMGEFEAYLTRVPNHPRVSTAAVDDQGNFYYNSDFIVKLADRGLGEVAGLIMHELSHIMADDTTREKAMVKIGDEAGHTRWNVASDYVNNYAIYNDFFNTNEERAAKFIAENGREPTPEEEKKLAVKLTLPKGGLITGDDGIIDRIPISNDEYIVFPPDKQIDLNWRSTESVYKQLEKLDDEIISHMDLRRNDAHLDKPLVIAEEIETIEGGDGENGPTTVVPGASLERVLVIDKQTRRPGIVIRDNESTKSVEVLPLTDEEYQDILVELGIDPKTMPTKVF